jgi:cell division protein FtsL
MVERLAWVQVLMLQNKNNTTKDLLVGKFIYFTLSEKLIFLTFIPLIITFAVSFYSSFSYFCRF